MTATSLRRRALRMPSIALGFAMALSAQAMAADLVISNWDGYMAPDAMASFKMATGVSGEVVVHATNEEIMGKLIAAGGKGYDVVFVSSPFAEVLNKLGLTEPMDHARIPNLANLYPEATKLPHDVGHFLRALYLGHDRPLLPLRPGQDGPYELERPAGAVR
ncbi:PotD/PotF family extracellular solute-binding protein [Mesorhizobium sp. WSM3626]|uniref:ABC transporter substrate-binding protein n=1 Tax=Mesorhizobium sp. WSM3626 TaxID=1040987 RepID=UPI0004B6D03D|nr:PotD/PotF family extracellular solute-binding protein [Mesorhizobium sp. WSM3626]